MKVTLIIKGELTVASQLAHPDDEVVDTPGGRRCELSRAYGALLGTNDGNPGDRGAGWWGWGGAGRGGGGEVETRRGWAGPGSGETRRAVFPNQPLCSA